MTVPPAVRYGTVTATFPDPPPGLQVHFRPDLRQPVARLTTVSPPLLYAIDEITATINSSGELLDPGGTTGVRLLADPDLEPHGFTWRVRISSPTTAPVAFSIAVTAGTTVDLSTVIPVPPALGQALADWQQAIIAAQAARDAAIAAAQGVAAGSAAAISAAIAALVGAAPDAMNTLQEIDAQLAADEGSAAALAALVATRAPLASPTFTGTVAGITAAMVGADASGAAAAAQAASLQKASNLGDLASPSAARTALGLGTAATHPATDFDPAGAASAVTLAALGGITPAAVAATYQPLLPATAVKTTAYSTAGNEIVPVDATAAGVTVTLPNAPADKTRATIKKIDSSANPVTIATAGSDVFNKAGGSTSASLTLLNQASTVQYVRATGVWLVVASDVPLSQLDARYATLAQQLLGWGYAQSFRLVSATRDGNEAITTGSVVWPDGATGTFTTDTASTAFPGAIDAYHVTHVLNGTTLTVTQTAVTRDAGGAVVNQPALTVA